MDEQLRIILIIIVSVSIFGLLIFVFVKNVIKNRIESLVEDNGMESFQRLAEPYRNQSKLIKNVDFTIEDGLHVFSKWYLIKQKKCCNNGCSNCPY